MELKPAQAIFPSLTEWQVICPADDCNEDCIIHSAVGNAPEHCPNCGAKANVHAIPDDERVLTD